MAELGEDEILAASQHGHADDVRRISHPSQGLADVWVVQRLRNLEAVDLRGNRVSSLEPFARCVLLRELDLRDNAVEDVAEVVWMEGLERLAQLSLAGNPVASGAEPLYRPFVLNILLWLTQFDERVVSQGERAEAASLTGAAMAKLWQRAQGLRAAHSPRRHARERASSLRLSIEVPSADGRGLPPPPPAASPRGGNVLTAVLTLLRELSPAELRVVEERCGDLGRAV